MDFGQILGGVLSSIAEGRSLSDRMSRELALHYQQDELMRAFPVPRMEIDNVEVDFKFAINDLELYREAVPQAFAATDAVALRARTLVGEQLPGLTSLVTVSRKAEALRQIGGLVENTVKAAVAAPNAMLQGAGRLAKKEGEVSVETLDLDRLAATIADSLLEGKWLVLKKNANRDELVRSLAGMLEPVKAAQEEEANRILAIPAPTGTPVVNAAFLYKDLIDIPREILSSIKLKVNVRNYEWTSVDEVDGQPVRKLVPE